VASLAAIVDAGANVVAVVTAPDKPSGRGLQMHETAVKQYAVSKNIPVLQPVKLKDPDFIATLKSYNADLHIVVAFRMLPVAVWDMPPMGTINVHASLLPQYRGAAPINRAIMNGETISGVTTFKLQHEIDTGNILFQQQVPILAEDNASTYHDKLMEAGAALLVATVTGLAAGTIIEQPQASYDLSLIKHAPKIFKEDTRINWDMNAASIHDFIRGLAPNPTAFTMLKDKGLKIFATHYEIAVTSTAIGTPDTDGKTYLRFAAKDGWVYIDDLQQEGKKRMLVDAFLRGFRL
jgi:methionyl-tRNA formyltransferase